jgi:MFS family permease
MKGTFGFGKFSIKLAIGYSPIHALIYLIGALFTISFFVFINSTQSFVLKEFLNYPTERLGEATGKLVFYDELLSVLVVVSWGILSDHIGKYLVFSAGFAIISISLAIFTFAADLYPQLLLFRLLFALGGSACSAMMTAVLADIAFEGDRGKFSGLVGLTSGLGALVGVFGFLRLPTLLGLRNSYFIVAAISLISGILLLSSWVSLKKRQEAGVETLNEDSLSISSQSNRKKLQLIYFVQSFKKGIFAAKDTKILLGYFSSFLARSDSVSITLFIPLWIYKYYLENDLCGATFALDDPDIKTVCHEAYLRSSVLSGVTQVFALIGAPFFGIL